MNCQPVTSPSVDRRKHKRYAMKGLAFAILKSDSDEELGQIIDLSRGGVAFQYFVGSKRLLTAEYLNIMLAKNSLYIDKIKVRTVFDFEIENKLPFSSISKRQQSLCFEELTAEQKIKVDYLIKHHTVQGP